MRVTPCSSAGESSSRRAVGSGIVIHAESAPHLGVTVVVGVTGASGAWSRLFEHSGPLQRFGRSTGVVGAEGESTPRRVAVALC